MLFRSMCVSAFAALVSMGGAPRASIMMGRGNKEEAERILGNCTSMLVLVAVIVTVVSQIWGQDILLLFGASESTLPYAWAYMQIYSLGTIFVQLALGLNAFINAQGFARTGMLTVVIGAVCNYYIGSDFYLWITYGGARSGTCNDSFAGSFLCVDRAVFTGKRNNT